MVDIDGLYHLRKQASSRSIGAVLKERRQESSDLLLIEQEPCPVDEDVATGIRIAKEPTDLLPQKCTLDELPCS